MATSLGTGFQAFATTSADLVSDPGFESSLAGFEVVTNPNKDWVSLDTSSPIAGRSSLDVGLTANGDVAYMRKSVAGTSLQYAQSLQVSGLAEPNINNGAVLEFCAAATYTNGTFVKQCSPSGTSEGTVYSLSATLTLNPSSELQYVYVYLYQNGSGKVDSNLDTVNAYLTLSGSAAPSPSPAPAPSPSPTKTASPSPSPTKTASPSPSPTKTASPSPSPTKTASPSPSPTKTASPSPTPTPTSTSVSSGGCQGILNPSYYYPGGTDWNGSVAGAGGVKIMIANPDSGPGTAVDPNYVSGIAQAQKAGIKVLGYSHTSYGARAAATVESEVSEYYSWYGVDGIFFDEAATASSTVSYYQTLYNYVHSLSSGAVVTINPGLYPDEGYMAAADIITVFEDSYSNYLSLQVPSWAMSYPANRFSHMVYSASGTSSLSEASVSPLEETWVTFLSLTRRCPILMGYCRLTGQPRLLMFASSQCASS